jgi:hypothetical protein
MSLVKDPGGAVKPVTLYSAAASSTDLSGEATAVLDTQPDAASGIYYSSVTFYAMVTLDASEATSEFQLDNVDIVEGSTTSPATAVDSDIAVFDIDTASNDGTYSARIATYDLAARERYMKLTMDADISAVGSETFQLVIIAVLAGANANPVLATKQFD